MKKTYLKLNFAVTITTLALLALPLQLNCRETNCNDQYEDINEDIYHDHPLLKLSPKIGFEMAFTRMRFEKDADKMFNRTQFPLSIFVNLNCSNFGIEAGYTMPQRKHKSVRFGIGNTVPGAQYPVPRPDPYEIYDATLEIRQPYVSLNYRYPLRDQLWLFGAVGLTSTKLRAEWQITDSESIDQETIQDNTKKFETRKTLPIIRIGLSYTLNDSFLLRFTTTWHNTSQLKDIIDGDEDLDHSTITLKAKNSIHCSIGIIYVI